MEPQSHRLRVSGKHDKSIAGLYDMETSSLGSGHFAVVKLARHVFTGEKVAVKVIDKSKLDEVAKAHLKQEVDCMKLVQHPNVVRLYEVIDTQSKLYLILEFGDGGDMYDHIMNQNGITEEKARHYFKQIVSAIDYCHKLHVVHRDLKPENVIFFKSQDLAKLTDFGFSNNFLPGEKLYTSCGSLAYSAPEILLGDSYDAPAVDVWSLGVILYMMVVGKGPFSHTNDSETLTMIMDCKYHLPDTLSEDCKSLISRMLVRKPSQRASLDSIVNDKWVTCGHIEKKSLSPAPLISEISISKEIHLKVLKQMEIGNVASKEEVEKSLQEDKYNHTTATYFLLAERILKKRHNYAALHVRLEQRHSYPYEYIANRTLDLEANCSKIGEDTNTETSDVEYRPQYPIVNDLTKEHSKSDECLNENSSSYTEFQLAPAPRSHRLTYPLFGMTKSSPNLLNEITEEQESELDESPRGSPLLQRRPSQRRRTYHNCRLSPIHSRRSSCSSSDDDDMYMLSDKRRLSGQHLTSVTVTRNTSQSGNNTNSGHNKTTESSKRNAPHTDDTINENILNEKMMSLFHSDLENNKNIENLLLPEVNLKLSGIAKYTYGRHFSDTNLTSYSMQLQLALAKGHNFKNGKYHSSKCSSDTNLVSTLCKKTSHVLLSDFLRTKDFFKSSKRGRNSSKNSSSLSLSSPIEEEPDGKPSNLPSENSFSDLREDQSGPGDTALDSTSGKNSIYSIDSSLKYHQGDKHSEVVESINLPDPVGIADTRLDSTKCSVHANIYNRTNPTASVCCSLV